MNSRFLEDLEALVRNHSVTSAQRDSEARLVAAISAVMSQTAREIVQEVRGAGTPANTRGSAMIRYRPDYDRGQQRQGAMIRYRPDYDRTQEPVRQGAMIRYRPDYDRGQVRQGAMIRYRPDWDRAPQRQGAMIRYRPDWDRQADGTPADPVAAGAGMLEPMLRALAERLGPGEAAKLVQSSLSNVGLAQAGAPAASPEAKTDHA
jgi:hypothetical protein